MSESHEKLFLHWSDSVQKFDYYLTGLLGASVVYLIKEYQPTIVGLNISTVELLAIICLIISLFAGITRIERNVTILRITHDLLPRETFLKTLRMRSPGQEILSEESLEVLSPEEIHAMEIEISETVKIAKEARDKLSRGSEILYSVRNVTLATGIILLLLAKVVKPYLPAG